MTEWGRELAEQVWGPEFRSQHPQKTLGTAVGCYWWNQRQEDLWGLLT